MRKKIALLLCMILSITICLNPAARTKVYAADHAAEVIEALGFMETDKGNTATGTDVVTRARYAQMLVNLSTVKEEVTSDSNISLFSDVKKSYWAAGYIQTAVSKGWMSGYLNGTFQPTTGISLQEAVYGIAILLGYSSSDFSSNKVSAIMNFYKTKGLNENISKTRTQYLTVNDCINLFYNTLNATTKDGKTYASVLGYTLDSNGDIDYLSLINSKIEGPIVAEGNWKAELPFSLTQAKLYKYGEACSYNDIEEYDVVYYSEYFKTVWIYDDKVTGTVEAINPDYTTPTSVTVGGNNYSFTDSDVTLRFSAMGDVKKGDVVTLLLGKDGTVVDVLGIDEYNTTITGVVLDLGTTLSEDENGQYTYKDIVTFVDASGNKNTKEYDADTVTLVEGGLVRVSYVNGAVTVSKAAIDSISFSNNTFNGDASAFGTISLASNVKILDLKDGKYISIYPERLAGVTLGSSTVYYYELNSDGELSQLILNDVTGDLDTYGVFTGYTSTGDKISYNYMIGSTTGALATNSVAYLSMNRGPKGLIFTNNTLTATFELSSTAVTSIGTTTLQDKTTVYPLAENCYAYILLDGEYVSTTIAKISDLSKYSLTAYYDSPVTSGGRIRVIIAQSNE